MIDIIIDIETLGTRPRCPIIEIGACAVDPDGGVIFSNFSRRVCSAYSVESVRAVANGSKYFGWKIEADTAEWWLAEPEREETLRRILATPIVADNADALVAFIDWFHGVTDDATGVRVWGNGPTFDLSILSETLIGADIEVPWHHTWERCVRTALEMAGHERGSVAWEEPGPRHRALNDARHEAKKLWRSGALGTVSEVAKRLRQLGTVKKTPNAERRTLNAQVEET
jgi:hypothetical protein